MYSQTGKRGENLKHVASYIGLSHAQTEKAALALSFSLFPLPTSFC